MQNRSQQLRNIIADLEQTSDVNNFSKMLDKFFELASEENKILVDEERYREASETYRLLAEACKVAALSIEKYNFTSLKDLSPSLSISAQNWEKQHNSAKISEHVHDAKKLQLQGKHDEAIHLFDKALSLEPSSKEKYQILLKMGNSYFYLNKLSDAKGLYEEAISLDRHNPLAWGNLGIILTSLYISSKDSNYLHTAVNKLCEGIELNPSDPVLYYVIGGAYYHLNDPEKALSSYKKSISKDKECADAWTAMAVVYNDGFGNYVEAKKCLTNALKICPDSMYTKINLAETHHLLKEYSQSRSLAKEVISKVNSLRFGLIGRIIALTSKFLELKGNDIGDDLLDLLSYYESLPIDFHAIWNFGNILGTVNETEPQSEVIRKLITLSQLSHNNEGSERRETIQNILTSIYRNKLFNTNNSTIESAAKSSRIHVLNTIAEHTDEDGKVRWKLDLDIPQDIYSNIISVKYQLPPSFPVPEYVMDNAAKGFALEGYAWDNFLAKILITFRSRQTSIKYCWLNLQQITHHHTIEEPGTLEPT